MSFKTFDLAHDVASIFSSINEVVFVSSSIFAIDANVKYYSNIASGSAATQLGGYFQSVYDSSPTSSLSTALMDFTFGYHTSSAYNVAATVSSSQDEKIKIYRMMASTLLGDPNAQFSVNGSSRPECFFILFKRNIQKDEIKKGATSIVFNQTASYQVTGSDNTAVTNFKQAPGGDYAPLLYNGTGSEIGQVWYTAGVVVVVPQLAWPLYQNAGAAWSGTVNVPNAMYSSSINQLVDGMRKAMDNVSIHNQTNLFSTVYFCRAQNTEFNYSSNPTFVDDNQRIRVTSGSNILQTRTYITTLGLYDANDNLLAVGKVNKPITKSPDNESIFRLRLDY